MKYKHLLTAMFWIGWLVGMANMILGLPVSAVIGDNGAEWVFLIISMLLLIGMAVVEAIEDKKPVIINLNGETTVNEVEK